VRALGVDVGVRRGLDVVLLDDSLVPLEVRRKVAPEDLSTIARELEADVVAIDAPPAWGRNGGSRLTEKELRWFGIQSYGTPSDPKKAENAFYEWMRIGFRAFDAVADRFPRYSSGPVEGSAIEVFPHATAVVLAGCLPPAGVSKRDWRVSVLRAAKVDVRPLRSIDLVDAALASLTGIYALRGRFSAPGDPREGTIVIPVRTLPGNPYRRCVRTPSPDGQMHLPGLTPCGCGDPACTALTKKEFAPGHESKRKSFLWGQARLGDTAVQELRRRGWAIPPEMR
jgi:predicted nuclease with RNAse H fold